MAVTTTTSREFNQDTARAKRAAKDGPVFITDRGEPRHVLLSIEEFRKINGRGMSLREALMDPNGDEYECDPPCDGRIAGRPEARPLNREAPVRRLPALPFLNGHWQDRRRPGSANRKTRPI